MAQTGQIIDGKFRIEELIGRGGMSRVYLARDTRLDKTWVVKEVRKQWNGQENTFLVEAALSEADIIKSLDHPAVVRIVDIVQDKYAVYIVEDHVEGISLKDYTDQKGPVDELRLKNWAVQLSRILIYLHSRNPPVIFRDLKPENVILTPSGHLKLVDFGIARRYRPGKTRDTVYLGTEFFAAPEQYEESGLQTDMRTDIYGLGKTLEYLAQFSSSLSPGFRSIIRRCLQQEPDARYPDAKTLLEELEHYEDRQRRFHRRRTRRRLLWTAAALCTAAGIAVLTSSGKSRAVREQVQTLMDTIREKEVFTKEEEEELLNLVLPELGNWKEEEGFEKTAFDIGSLYWNYYVYGTDHTAGMTAAVPWFAMARGYSPSAQVYEMIGEMRENIRQTDLSAWEKGTYASYCERLRTMLAHAEKEDMTEDIRLEVCALIADVLASCTEQFCADHVEQDQLEDLIRRAQQLVDHEQESPRTEQQRIRISRSLALARNAVERIFKKQGTAFIREADRRLV